MTFLELKTAGLELKAVNRIKLSSGNVQSVGLSVAFDKDWDGYARSAVFYTEKGAVYEKILDGYDKCLIPHEVLEKSGATLTIGVRGISSSTGAVKASLTVEYEIYEGAPAGQETTSEPSPDVYQQILSTYGQMLPAFNAVSEYLGDGIFLTMNGEKIRLFIGTEERYMELPDEDRRHYTYAIITDDQDVAKIYGIASGETPAKSAEAISPKQIDDAFIAEKGDNIDAYNWNYRYVCSSLAVVGKLVNLPRGVEEPFVLDSKSGIDFIQQELTTCAYEDRKPRRFIRNYFFKYADQVAGNSHWGDWVEVTIAPVGTSYVQKRLIYREDSDVNKFVKGGLHKEDEPFSTSVDLSMFGYVKGNKIMVEVEYIDDTYQENHRVCTLPFYGTLEYRIDRSSELSFHIRETTLRANILTPPDAVIDPGITAYIRAVYVEEQI